MNLACRASQSDGARVLPGDDTGRGTYVTIVTFSPDGMLLVTSDDSGNITEWDVSVSRVTR